MHPPWATQALSADAIDHLMSVDWSSEEWDYPGIFFEGKFGRWVGYTTGYRLAKTSGVELGPSLTDDLTDTFSSLISEHREALVGTDDEWRSRLLAERDSIPIQVSTSAT